MNSIQSFHYSLITEEFESQEHHPELAKEEMTVYASKNEKVPKCKLFQTPQGMRSYQLVGHYDPTLKTKGGISPEQTKDTIGYVYERNGLHKTVMYEMK